MKTLEQKIEVMQAAADGKEIEGYNNGHGTWDHQPTPQFNWMDIDYRIKPEPMEFWVNVYEPTASICYGFHETKDSAASVKSPDCIKTIKVREVIE